MTDHYYIKTIHLFINQCQRELIINSRQLRNLIFSAIFFCMIIVFFPLTIVPNIKILRSLAPGLIWISMLLTIIAAADRLFQHDYEHGVVEQWLASGMPVSIIVVAKICMHWLLTLIPILIMCLFVSVLFSLSVYEEFIIVISLILGTPTLVFVCALASASCNGSQQNSALLPLILLPLVVPVMIFGSGTVIAVMNNLAVAGYLAILSALSLLSITFLPIAIATIIKISFVLD